MEWENLGDYDVWGLGSEGKTSISEEIRQDLEVLVGIGLYSSFDSIEN